MSPNPSMVAEFMMPAPPLPGAAQLKDWIDRYVSKYMPHSDDEMYFVHALGYWLEFSPGTGSEATIRMDILWCLERHY